MNKAGDGKLLREVLVQRAGHCQITPAETVAALQALVTRLDTGKWKTDTSALNAAAAALGPLNIAPPSFVDFQPRRFLRPYPISPN